ncbi:hypothetical protein GQ457_14G016530 [Hibiscus cannabinus]
MLVTDSEVFGLELLQYSFRKSQSVAPSYASTWLSATSSRHRQEKNIPNPSFASSNIRSNLPIPSSSPKKSKNMALEWVVLSYTAGAEAIMVLLLTLPSLDGYILKYETWPSNEADSCTSSEHLRHQKSIMKSQCNVFLIDAALLFYWLFYSVTHLVVRVEQLNQRLERNKNKEQEIDQLICFECMKRDEDYVANLCLMDIKDDSMSMWKNRKIISKLKVENDSLSKTNKELESKIEELQVKLNDFEKKNKNLHGLLYKVHDDHQRKLMI